MTCPVCESCKDLGWCIRLREAEAERDAALAQVAAMREAAARLMEESRYKIGKIYADNLAQAVRALPNPLIDSENPKLYDSKRGG